LSRGISRGHTSRAKNKKEVKKKTKDAKKTKKTEEEYHCWPGWGMGMGMRFSNTTPHSPPESLAFS